MTQAFIVTPYAAALGLLGAALTINVIVNRGRTRTTSGDGEGGAPALAQAIRAHCNFVEQAPLTLIVIALGEAAGMTPVMVNLLGAGLVISRLAAALGLSRTLSVTSLRVFGAGLGVFVLVTASITALLAWLKMGL
jgi:uncharacterized membrane protein YecN with MAPEG domain